MVKNVATNGVHMMPVIGDCPYTTAFFLLQNRVGWCKRKDCWYFV